MSFSLLVLQGAALCFLKGMGLFNDIERLKTNDSKKFPYLVW